MTSSVFTELWPRLRSGAEEGARPRDIAWVALQIFGLDLNTNRETRQRYNIGQMIRLLKFKANRTHEVRFLSTVASEDHKTQRRLKQTERAARANL